jgi:undecaprenyl pyrophosphate phosphatase UppP
MVLVAFLPAHGGRGLLNDVIERIVAESLTVIAIAFIAGGLVMLLVEVAAAGRARDPGRPDAAGAAPSGSACARRWR